MEDKFNITTSSGFEYEIAEDVLDDMEMFEDLIILEDPDEPQFRKVAATNRMFVKMLGPEQKTKLDRFLKERDGKVKISVYQKEIREIFQSMNKDKKK